MSDATPQQVPQQIVVFGMQASTLRRVIKLLKRLPMEDVEEMIVELENSPQLNLAQPGTEKDGDQ